MLSFTTPEKRKVSQHVSTVNVVIYHTPEKCHNMWVLSMLSFTTHQKRENITCEYCQCCHLPHSRKVSQHVNTVNVVFYHTPEKGKVSQHINSVNVSLTTHQKREKCHNMCILSMLSFTTLRKCHNMWVLSKLSFTTHQKRGKCHNMWVLSMLSFTTHQ